MAGSARNGGRGASGGQQLASSVPTGAIFGGNFFCEK